MIKEMRQVKVSVDNDDICISQGDEGPHGDGPSTIYLRAEQIDTLVAWLSEAKQEAASPSNHSVKSDGIMGQARGPGGSLGRVNNN